MFHQTKNKKKHNNVTTDTYIRKNEMKYGVERNRETSYGSE